MNGNSNRNRLAKMRLQQRYNNNNSSSNGSSNMNGSQTIGGNNNNSNNININGNNRIHNQRAKLLNLINNNNNRNNNNISNNSNGFFKLRSTTKSTPTTTTTKNRCNNNNQAMQLDADVDDANDEIVETLEETTTAVELRSTAAANSCGSSCGNTGSGGRAYTTLRSNSTSAILAEVVRMPSLMGSTSSMLYARPRTLNVHNICQTPAQITQLFFGYVFVFILFCFKFC